MSTLLGRVGMVIVAYFFIQVSAVDAEETPVAPEVKDASSKEEAKTEKKADPGGDEKDVTSPEVAESPTPSADDDAGTSDPTEPGSTDEGETQAPEPTPEPTPESNLAPAVQSVMPHETQSPEESGVVVAVESSAPAPIVTEEVKPDTPKYLQGTWTKSILFSTENGLFQFQPRGWVQPVFRFHVNQEATDGESVVTDTGFGLQRGRFGFQAYLFKWAHVYLDTGWKAGSGKIVDFFVDVGPNNGKGAFAVRAGYFRPFYCRQLLMATTKLAMVDYARAWTDPTLGMGLGRDMGVGFYGFVAGGIEYGVGLWNGNMNLARSDYGDDAIVRSDGATDLQTGGRLAVHPLSLFGVGNPVKIGNESDSNISKKPGLALGVSFMFDKFAHQQSSTDIAATFDNPSLYNGKSFRFGTDLAFKYQGFSLIGELFLIQRWADDSTADEQADRQQFEDHNMQHPGIGAYVQMGMFVDPKRVEIVGRFDVVDENVEVRGIRFYPTAGITYYIFGNNLKLQGQWRVNVGTKYLKEDDTPIVGETAGFIPVSHDFLVMLQLAI